MSKENSLISFHALFIFALVTGLFFFKIEALQKIEFSLYDSLLGQVNQSEPSGMVVIVDIDEKSLSEHGQWPWPRNKVALLLERIKELGALSIGLDFVFAEPDRTSINFIYDSLNKDFDLNLSTKGIPKQLQSNDQTMANILASGPFVLGYGFVFDEKSPQYLHSTQHKIDNLNALNLIYKYEEDAKPSLISWHLAKGRIANLELFSQSTSQAGFFNVLPELDGIIRKVPLIIEYNHKEYPNLSLATLMAAVGLEQMVLNVAIDGERTLLMAEQEIPLDSKGNMWVHFRNTQKPAFKTISASDILNNRVDISDIRDRVILLGTSAIGLHDLRTTPYNSNIAGVYVHASVIDNILRGDFILRPINSNFYEFLIMLLMAIISIIVTFKFKALNSLWIHLILLSLLSYACFWGLEQGIYISIFYSILILVINFSLLSVLQYHLKEVNLIKQVMQTELAEQLALKTEKEKKIIEVAHNNIRDSISYASLIQTALLPDAAILNKYFQDSFVYWQPKDKVGGDIYFISEIEKTGEIVLMVLDGTGHGVPGAFVTMLVKAIQTQIVADIEHNKMNSSPAEMLAYFNRNIKIMLKQDKNSSSNAGFDGGILVYNKNSKQVTFSGAKTPLFYIQDNELNIIKGNRHSVGYKTSDPLYEFTDVTIDASEGMCFYLTTDGFLDQIGGEKSIPLGKKRFTKVIHDNYLLDMSFQSERLISSLLEYQADASRNDDVTIAGFKV